MNHVNKTGAVLTNVTCDNPRVNVAMLTSLGAILSGDNPQPYLKQRNIMGLNVLAFLDPPHLIKLTRNTLGDLGVLLDKANKKILWVYIRRLHELQKMQGMHLANKLKQEHIDYSKNRMKVRLATQVISQSVANSLLHCLTNLELPQFDSVEATAKFLKTFDILFDIHNSRYIDGKFSKAPLGKKNYEIWSTNMKFCEDYIYGLKYKDGKSVLTGPRKAAFIGWLNDIRVIRIMYENYILKGITIQYIIHL